MSLKPMGVCSRSHRLDIGNPGAAKGPATLAPRNAETPRNAPKHPDPAREADRYAGEDMQVPWSEHFFNKGHVNENVP